MLSAHLSEGFLYVAARNLLAAIVIAMLVVAELRWDSEGRPVKNRVPGQTTEAFRANPRRRIGFFYANTEAAKGHKAK